MSTILVIDDSLLTREYVARLLGYQGHRVIEASDGVEALGAVRIEHPDLVITDLLMPTMDGFEFVQRLRAIPGAERMPVIIFSATYQRREARSLAERLGVAAILDKPAEPDTVLEVVEAALASSGSASNPLPREDFTREHAQVLADKVYQKVVELEAMNEKLAALNAVVQALAGEPDPLQILGHFCRSARDIVAARYAAVALLADDWKTIRHFETSGIDARTRERIGAPPIGCGLFAELFRQRTPVRIRDLRAHSGATGFPPHHPEMRSLVCVPVITGTTYFGALYLADKIGADEFSEEDERLTGILAAGLAVALENAERWSKMRESETRYRALVERLPALTYVAENDPRGRLLYVSPQIESMLGIRADEWIASPGLWVEAVHPEDRERVLNDARRLAKGVTAVDSEFRLVARGGREVWVHSRTVVVRDDLGRPLFRQGIVFDITEQRQAEQQIRENEARQALILRTVPITLYTAASREGFSTTWIAENVGRLTGFGPHDFTEGNVWAERIHPGDRARVLREFTEGVERGFVSSEYRWRRADGEWRWLLDQGGPTSGRPDEFLGSRLDITERKRAEAELELRARQQAAVAKIGQIALGEHDLDVLMSRAVSLVAETLEVEMCQVLELLPGGEALLLRAGVGWKDGLVGRTTVGAGIGSQAGYGLAADAPVIVEDLQSEARFSAAPLLRDHGVVSGMSVTIEAGKRPWGVLGAHAARSRRFTDDDVKFLCAVANLLAVAIERARAEEKMRSLQAVSDAGLSRLDLDEMLDELLARIRNALASDWAAILLLAEDGRELFVRASSGLDPERLRALRVPLGRGVAGRVAAERRAMVVDDLSKVEVASPDLRVALRSLVALPLLAEDRLIGVLHVGSETPRHFSDDDVQLLRLVADRVATSIDRARVYEAERQLRVEFEERVAQRTAELRDVNAELQSFSYSVSHDLRAPLRAIQGFAEALLEDHGSQLDETGLNYARRLSGAAARLDGLIQDLLAYSRITREEVKLSGVPLDAVLSDALSQIEAQLRERHADVSVEKPLPRVRGHRSTLIQVTANLLSNAVKFVAPGVEPRVRVQAERHEGAVRLWVADNGIGIAPEHQERIFRVFERLHGIESYPGTGIGLAIVRKGVERIGGQVGVESRPGEGSRFWIQLPGSEE